MHLYIFNLFNKHDIIWIPCWYCIEQELYQSIFNCSDDNLSILEEGKLLESLSVINPDCRNVNFAIFGVSLATINFVLSFVISSFSYYLYSYAKN